MKLSLPIFRLKRAARVLSRETGVALHKALDQVARTEGFRNWSHLAAKHTTTPAAARMLRAYAPGDMVLLAARPEQGKTMLSLDLLAQAARSDRPAYFFTLEYNHEVASRALASRQAHEVILDTSDDICAAHIITALTGVTGAVAAVDYLQLLDQKRSHPPLAAQVTALKAFAVKSGAIVIFTAQIDRNFAQQGRTMPGLDDIRLPNPVDLGVFDKCCFLQDGELRLVDTHASVA